MSEQHDRAMMDNLYWWGVPTLFRCEQRSSAEGLDVALVGVPHSAGNGTTERDQHLGPRAVRNVSAVQRRVHMNFGIDPWDLLKIGDLGDVPFPEANDNEASIQRMTDFFVKVDKAGARPVSIGGDHSVTGGILQALGAKNSNMARGEKIALLHMDAHTDVFTSVDHFLGAKKALPIGVPIWLTRVTLIRPRVFRSAFAEIPAHWTGYRAATTTVTMW